MITLKWTTPYTIIPNLPCTHWPGQDKGSAAWEQIDGRTGCSSLSRTDDFPAWSWPASFPSQTSHGRTAPGAARGCYSVLGQMLSVDIFVEVPLQVCLSGNKDTWDVNSGSTCLAFSGLIPIPLLLVIKETEKWYLGKILLCSKNYTLSKFRTTSHEINVSTIYSSSVLKNHLEVLYLTYKTHYIIVRCFFFFNGQSLRMKNNCLWTVYYHRLNC